ncbi:uncharacterized protein LOC143186254 [Calliopsis andreniformis]|uniref:uncharacterized protein LOC143186254 n=1 Tax=Calliopsis andreniformis TaxID=337506 RepID=UPI003FCCC8BA
MALDIIDEFDSSNRSGIISNGGDIEQGGTGGSGRGITTPTAINGTLHSLVMPCTAGSQRSAKQGGVCRMACRNSLRPSVPSKKRLIACPVIRAIFTRRACRTRGEICISRRRGERLKTP